MTRPMGIDLDNTIIDYEQPLKLTLARIGLAELQGVVGKQQIREAIKNQKDGEVVWQKIQAHIYGPGLSEARLFEGAWEFFGECDRREIPIVIISHKSNYATYDTTRTNLRSAAMHWLTNQGFFDRPGTLFSQNQVFFAADRQGKIDLIKKQRCRLFIDDLVEVFAAPDFPATTAKYLFDPQADNPQRTGMTGCRSWSQLADEIFSQDVGCRT